MRWFRMMHYQLLLCWIVSPLLLPLHLPAQTQPQSIGPSLQLYVDGQPFTGDSITLSTLLRADSIATGKYWVVVEAVHMWVSGVCINAQGIYDIPIANGRLTPQAKKLLRQLNGRHWVSFVCEQARRIFGDSITVGLRSLYVLPDKTGPR